MPTTNEIKEKKLKSGSFQHYTWIIPVATAEALYIGTINANAWRKTHTWERTPNFKSYRPRDRPMNNRDLKYMEWTGSSRSLCIQTDGYYNLSMGNPFLTFPRTTDVWPVPSTVLAQSVSKIVSNVQGAKVNLGQMMLERRQTVNLVATTASRLAQSYFALRRGNLDHAFKALALKRSPPRKVLSDYRYRFSKSPDDAASSLWLELQYGWKPLLSDIYDSAELLAESAARRNPVCEVKGRGFEKTVNRNFPIFFGNLGNQAVGSQTEQYSALTCIQYTISNEMASVLSKTGISNPALLAWELMPYSFVIDWFLPVGQYLESFTAYDGLTFRSGYQVTRTISMANCQPAKTSWRYGTYASCTASGQLSFKGARYTRSKLTGFPRASFPSLKNPFSPSHAASAISLLVQAFRR